MAGDIWTNAARYLIGSSPSKEPAPIIAPIAHSANDLIIRYGGLETKDLVDEISKIPSETSLKMAQASGGMASYLSLFGFFGQEVQNRPQDMLKYSQVWAVHRAISIKASNIAKIPWNIYRGDDLVERTPFHDLMEQPAKGWTNRRLIYALLADWELVGDAYLEVISRQQARAGGEAAIEPSQTNPVDIVKRIMPDKIDVIADPDSNQIDSWRIGDRKLEPWQVFNLSTYSPTSERFGHSHTQSGASLVNSLQHVLIKIAKYFKEEYQQAGYLSTDERLTQEDFKAIQNQQAMNRGARRQGRIPIFTAGLKWAEFGSDKESKLIAAIQQLSRLVGESYGVPDALMGFADDVGSHARQREIRRQFHEDTLDPIVKDFQEQLTRFAREYFLIGEDEYVWFEIQDVIQQLRDKGSIEQRAISLWNADLLTRNQALVMIEQPEQPPEVGDIYRHDLKKDLVESRAATISTPLQEIALIAEGSTQKQLGDIGTQEDPLRKKKDHASTDDDGRPQLLRLDHGGRLSTPSNFLDGGSGKETKLSDGSERKKKRTANG